MNSVKEKAMQIVIEYEKNKEEIQKMFQKIKKLAMTPQVMKGR